MFVGPIVLLYIYGKETSSTILFSMIGMIGLYQFLGQIIIPDMDQWIQQKIRFLPFFSLFRLFKTRYYFYEKSYCFPNSK